MRYACSTLGEEHAVHCSGEKGSAGLGEILMYHLKTVVFSLDHAVTERQGTQVLRRRDSTWHTAVHTMREGKRKDGRKEGGKEGRREGRKEEQRPLALSLIVLAVKELNNVTD